MSNSYIKDFEAQTLAREQFPEIRDDPNSWTADLISQAFGVRNEGEMRLSQRSKVYEAYFTEQKIHHMVGGSSNIAIKD